MAKQTSTVDTVVSLCKRRGFVFPSGEIYGGTRSAWDYGPLGVELKENIKRQWWKVDGHQPRRRRRPRLLDHPAPRDVGRLRPRRDVHRPARRVPHLPQAPPRRTTCRRRSRRRRASSDPDYDPDDRHRVPQLRHQGQWTEPREFNMMLKTYLGVIEDESGLHYLRPETAQGIFVNFLNVMQAVAQEAAVRHRPDRQELPQRDHARQLHLPHARVRADGDGVLRQARRGRGVAPVLDRRAHRAGTSTSASTPTTCATTSTPKEKLSHYSKRTVDIEYRFNFTGSRVGRARGHRQPHRLRPDDAHASTRAPTSSTSTRRRARSTRPTSSSRRPACRAR